MNKDPFEQHGIEHLSASQIIQFARDPAHYILERLIMKKEFTANPFTVRGQAAEMALAEKLFDPKKDDEVIIKEAHEKYHKDLLYKKFPDKQKQKELIEPMFQLSYDALKDYGLPTRPNQFQHKITLDIGKEFPEVIGYLDFWWQQHNIIVDLKTSTSLPSYIKEDHQWQGTIYAAAEPDNEVRFCYVTGKKCAVYSLTPEQIKQALHQVKWYANKLKDILGLSQDAQELPTAANLIPRYMSSYGSLNYWWDAESRAAGKKVFGI